MAGLEREAARIEGMEATTQKASNDTVRPESPVIEVRPGKCRGRRGAKKPPVGGEVEGVDADVTPPLASPGDRYGLSEKASRDAAASIALSVEAILLSVDKAVAPGRIAEAVFRPEAARELGRGGDEDRETQASSAEVGVVDGAVALLNTEYERSGRSFRIESVAGGYRLMTLAAHSAVIAAFKRARLSAKLSRAAVETLAIIAYRQPVTRAELEAIRGVACGEVLKSLMDRRLVTIKGRAEEIGRPILYGTTRQFLDHFGIASLKDLPAPADVGGTRARDA